MVFEPNDANTWVKVKATIKNFLTTQWRAGARQGTKPKHAFYVAVGLGKTMTSLGRVEGRIIVDIGIAPLRPAEFIILRFCHMSPADRMPACNRWGFTTSRSTSTMSQLRLSSTSTFSA